MNAECGPCTLAIPAALWHEIIASLDGSVESAAMLLVRTVGQPPGPITLLVREIAWVPTEAYLDRTSDGLTIRSFGWVPAFARAEQTGCLPVFVHTHPGAAPSPSPRDHHVEEELATVAETRLDNPAVAALIIGGTSARPTFTGRLRMGRTVTPLDRIRVASATTRLLLADGSLAGGAASGSVDDAFDRQIRAFGEDGQRILGAMRIGVVGAGGTGSAVIEQLLRLGVGHLTVIDPQTLQLSNVTRVHGSGRQDKNTPKVDLAARQNERIGLGSTVSAIVGDVTTQCVAESLVHCDIVFGCTDDHAGRGVLTRLPTYLLTTLLDIGVVLDSTKGMLTDVVARLTAVTPGSPCLFCTNDIDPALAAIEQLPAPERERQRAEGYAPELDTADPAVVAYTTLIASIAVSEMLDRVLTHLDTNPANRLLVRVHDRAISTLRQGVGNRHWCQDPSTLGAGVTEPLFGLFNRSTGGR